MPSENNGFFKGSTKQALSDMNSRLDRIEAKLDRVIEKNIIFAGLVGGGVSIVVAVIAALSI